MDLRARVLLLLAVSCAGCQGAQTTTNDDRQCEPLAAKSVPLELGLVLGAGKSTDGTLYVVDQSEQEKRVFVSEGDELVFHVASGTGETNSGDGRLLSFSFVDQSPELHVELWLGEDGSKRMGVLERELPRGAKEFEIGQVGEDLELVTEDDLRAFTARDDTVESFVEYAASVADDRFLVVIRPERYDSSGYRVFFGPLEHLRERTVTILGQVRSSTMVQFDVDGEVAAAAFPLVFSGSAEPTLTLGGVEVDIELLPEGELPQGAAYFCSK
jgi:hypothetical protein